MDLVSTHQPVDDAIRASNDLANLEILELGNSTARFGEDRKLGGRRDQLPDDNRGVMR